MIHLIYSGLGELEDFEEPNHSLTGCIAAVWQCKPWYRIWGQSVHQVAPANVVTYNTDVPFKLSLPFHILFLRNSTGRTP